MCTMKPPKIKGKLLGTYLINNAGLFTGFFLKGLPLRCGYISAQFKEPEMVLIIGKGELAFLGRTLPQIF